MPKSLDDFYKQRIPYEIAARERASERLNRGDDSPYWSRITDEMIMDLLERVEKLEAIINPPDAPKTRR